jgi:putative spermidine/putrescine transport system permease protein
VVVPISFSSASYLAFPPPNFSIQWWQEFFQRRDWISSTLLSFRIAIVATAFATTLGTAVSFTLVRSKFWGKDLVYSIILSPLVVPTIIIAISLYFHLSAMQLIGNWIAIALGHSILGLPYVVTIVASTLKGLDESFEHAAMSLGANRLQTFYRVTFPLIRPGVFTGAFFAFMTSFDELLISMFLSGTSAVTLPKRLWDGIRFEINPTIPVAATLMMSLSFAVLLSTQLIRKRNERLAGGKPAG